MGMRDKAALEVEIARLAIEGARAGGLRRLIYTSVLGADRPRGVGILDAKYEIEKLIRASRIPHLILRCGSYMEDVFDPRIDLLNKGTFLFSIDKSVRAPSDGFASCHRKLNRVVSQLPTALEFLVQIVRAFFVACMVGSFAITGCGDSGTGGGGGSGGGDACLQGVWDCTLPNSSTAEMTISGTTISGSFTEMSVTLTVMADFSLDGDEFSVVDSGGSGACPSTQTGIYTYACGSDELTFTEVSDDCVGRSNFFSCTWQRR